MRLRNVVPLGLVLALTACAPAAAVTHLGGVSDTADDPGALAVTPRALIYSSAGDEEPYGIFEQRAERRVRRLRQFESLRALRPRLRYDEVVRGIQLAASSSLIAVAVSTVGVFVDGAEDSSDPGPSALDVAAPTGRAIRIQSCRAAELGPVAVSGRTVAYVGAGCDNARAGIGVRDIASGAARVLRPPAAGRFWDVQLAGRHMAGAVEGGSSDGDVIVYDWRRGRELYRIPGPPFALQDDGKVATLGGAPQPGCDVGDARWYSPAEPRAHVVPERGCFDDWVFMAHDRILSSRFLSAPVARGDLAQSDFVVSDLAGSDTMPLFTAQAGSSLLRVPVYFDGTRVGYSTPGCDARDRMVVDTVDHLARTGPVGQELCTVSLKRVPAQVKVRGRLHRFVLEFACRHGCEGRIRLWDPAEERYIGFYGSGEYASMGAPPSSWERHELGLTDTEGKRLRRLGRLDLELRVEVLQIAGGSIVRTQPIALLAAP